MISCAFPPIGGPGVQRSAKFAKYLPQFGWRPIVWAARNLPGLPLDPSLLADLPRDLDVHRSPCSRFWSPATPADRPPTGLRSALHWRLRRWQALVAYNLIPDPMIFWALAGYRRLRRIIAQERIDVIYSTYSPASNHLLGWLLHRATGWPWVADFRDLWTDDYGYSAPRWRKGVDRALENCFLRDADVVLAVTDTQRDALAARCPDQPGKFLTVTNGVDLADFEQIDRSRISAELHGPADRFVLAFTGWFLSDRVEPALIEGLARFGRAVQQGRGTFELRIVGTISEQVRGRLAACSVAVQTPGYLPHRQAIAHMLSADALLLPLPSGPQAAGLMTGKIFEYLAAGRPILLVGPPDGEAQRLVRRCNAGRIVPAEPDAVCAALTDLRSAWSAGHPVEGCHPDCLAPFTRRHLAGQLASILTRAAAIRQA